MNVIWVKINEIKRYMTSMNGKKKSIDIKLFIIFLITDLLYKEMIINKNVNGHSE